MNLWLGAIFAVFCALAGAGLGYWFSRRGSPWWLLGYFIPLILIATYAVAFRVPSMMFTPPVSWMMMGLKKFAVLGFVETMIFTSLLSRIPQKRERRVIVLLMTVIAFFMCVWPFLAPAFARNQLTHLKTSVDGNGVCLQTTEYTCGPAAAVTAVRKLGFPAEEGEIAIASATSPQEGTPTDMLADALEKNYGHDGLQVKCRAFKSVAELKSAGITLAVIKYSFLVDHWVTVLEVTENQVIVGDPLNGLEKLSYAEFGEKWRFVGIVLHRR